MSFRRVVTIPPSDFRKEDIEELALHDCESNDNPETNEDGTLTVWIDPGTKLENVLDEVRKNRGYRPFFMDDEECEFGGWYEFYANVSRDGSTRIAGEVSIECDTLDDDSNMYEIILTGEQSRWLHDRIRNLFGEEKWNEIFEEKEDMGIDLTQKQYEVVKRSLDAFVENFGTPRIEKNGRNGFFVYVPSDAKDYVQYCRNIDRLEGWLYGCVQGALVIRHLAKNTDR